jgi:hypothetical protein
MPQVDFDFNLNATGSALPLGGNDGRAQIHAELASPLILEGDFARRYLWESGDSTLQTVLATAVDAGIWRPTGTLYGFDVSAALRVSSVGTPNKAIGLAVKTGRSGTQPGYRNLSSGYTAFLGAWNIGGTIYGSPDAVTLLMVPADNDGANLRAITVTSGLNVDEWHYVRLSVIPNGTAEDTVKVYKGVKNAGLSASIVAGASAGVSGAAATMAAPSGSFITVTGLTGMTANDRGSYITFSGAVDLTNNGTFRIYNVVSTTEIEIIRTADASGGHVTNGSEGGLAWSTKQMRVTGLAGLTSRSVGRQLTLAGATSIGNNGTFFIASANETEADVVNADAVIPDLNNGGITWIEGAAAPQDPTDPIWTEVHSETIDSTDPHYCAWTDAISNRIGYVAHNSSGAGGEVFIDRLKTQRELIP